MSTAPKTALLIIDVQAALCSGRYEVFEARRMIERINAVSRRVREAGGTVVLVQHEASEGPMVHGAPGWQLAEGLHTEPGDLHVYKTGSDAFHHTALHELLQSHGIERLIVCGVQSEFCVDSTVRRALALGYPVTLVSDAHATRDNGVLSAAQIAAHHNITWQYLDSYGPRVTPVAADALRLDA